MKTRSDCLNAKSVMTKPAGRWPDGDGLQLSVKPSGARSWIVTFRVAGARKEMGLGCPPEVALAQAREAARAARLLAVKGINPIDARRGVSAPDVTKKPTFGPYAEAYVDERLAAGALGARTAQNWRNSIRNHGALLTNKPLDEITTTDITTILRPIWSETPEIAQKTQSRYEDILDAAKAEGLRTGDNPARWNGHLRHILTAREKLSRGHHKSLAYEEAPSFVRRLRGREGKGIVALELTVLIGARTSEVLLATWREFDLEAKVWSLPAERTKNWRTLRRQGQTHHRVPLSTAAIATLERLGPGTADAHLFAAPTKSGLLSNGTMAAVLRRMGVPVTVHGFRSTVRDWGGGPARGGERALGRGL